MTMPASARDAVAHRGQAAGAGRLLVGDRVHDQVAAQPDAEPASTSAANTIAADAALHVAGAAAVQVAVAHLGRLRVARPALARLGRDDVDVAVQEQAAAAARSGEAWPPAAAGRRSDRAGGIWPRAGHVLGRRLPDVDGGAGGAQPVAEVAPAGRPRRGPARPPQRAVVSNATGG